MLAPTFLVRGHAMKTIHVKPVPEIAIKLKDKTYKCTFNMLAMANMQEAFGTLEKEEGIDTISPAHMCAFVLYAGIKANDDDFTMDEAKALAMAIGPGSYGEIIGMFNEAVMDSIDDKTEKELKKTLAQKVAQIIK